MPLFFFFVPARHPPRCTLSPYTTLFRSHVQFEVIDFAALPDKERVAFGGDFLGRASDNGAIFYGPELTLAFPTRDRKSTRLNSSHLVISYTVFCLNNTSAHQ